MTSFDCPRKSTGEKPPCSSPKSGGYMEAHVRSLWSRSGCGTIAATPNRKETIMTDHDVAPGWYLDPSGQGDARYWNGTSWTATINRQGTKLNVAIDPALAGLPPTPGTEVHLPIPVSTQYALTPPQKRSPIGAIVGILIALAVVIVVIVVLSNTSSDDTPQDPETPPATAPAEQAPAETG